MSDDKEYYLDWNFSVGPDYCFTKNRCSWISHANLARWWWRSSKISSSTVVDLCFFCMLCNDCLEQQLPLEVTEFFCGTLLIKQLTDDLLTTSVTFTWFYKTENIVM